MKTILSVAAIGLLIAASLVMLLVGDGNLALGLVPLALIAVLCLVAMLPLRYPLLFVTFLALTLENPADVPAAGQWKSALYPLGTLLLAHLNLSFPTQKWLFFSGLDLVLVFLAGLAVFRWLTRSRLDGAASVPTSAPMRIFAIVSLVATAWMWIWGMARGGADASSALWQVQRVVYLPAVFFLFERVLRTASDREAFAKVVVLAAAVKAVLAIYLRSILVPPPGRTVIDYATTHADSMLFAGAVCLIMAQLLQRKWTRTSIAGALLLPLLVAGMVANHRRLVWVELIAGVVTVFAMSQWTPAKRTVARVLILSAPVLLLYVAIGWGSSGEGIFGPVGTIRSVVDSKADASTEWRDWENYNLFFTLKGSPILGTGYGHGYIETVKLPDVSGAYSLYRFIPHNSILGLWAYGGLLGFAALWAMLVVAIYLAARAARFARTKAERSAALVVICGIVVYLVHCYGDMGLGTWTSVFLIAPAFAAASHLAAATGAWPRRVPAAPKWVEPEIIVQAPPAFGRREEIAS